MNPKFLKDTENQIRMTPRQWAKRALGRIGKQHLNDLSKELEGLNETEAGRVRQEFERMVRMLENRRGFLIS